MLETLFVVGFVLVPLTIAVILIAYRARFVILGIVALIVLLVIIWLGLKAANIVDRTFDPEVPARSMPGNCTGTPTPSGDCRL
jgi:hypothetical protein